MGYTFDTTAVCTLVYCNVNYIYIHPKRREFRNIDLYLNDISSEQDVDPSTIYSGSLGIRENVFLKTGFNAEPKTSRNRILKALG